MRTASVNAPAWDPEKARVQVAIRVSGRWASGPLPMKKFQCAAQEAEWWEKPETPMGWLQAISDSPGFDTSRHSQAFPHDQWQSEPWRVPLESGLAVMDFDRREAWGWLTTLNHDGLLSAFAASSDTLDASERTRAQVRFGRYREAIDWRTGIRFPLSLPADNDTLPAFTSLSDAFVEITASLGVSWSEWVYWDLLRTQPGWTVRAGGKTPINDVLQAWLPSLTAVEQEFWLEAIQRHLSQVQKTSSQSPVIPDLLRGEALLRRTLLNRNVTEAPTQPHARLRL